MDKEKRKRHLWIDSDTADRITVHNLKDYRKYLKKELSEWKKNPKTESNPTGYWLHPEDVVINMRTVEALDLIINHFVSVPDLE